MHGPNPCPAFRGWGWVRSSLRVSRRERSKLLLPPRRFAPAGLILTHRCNLSLLLFHSHRSLPMRGYHSSLLYLGFLTLPFHRSFPPSPPTPPPSLYSLLLYMPTVCQYSCTISSYARFETRDDAYDVTLSKNNYRVLNFMNVFVARS